MPIAKSDSVSTIVQDTIVSIVDTTISVNGLDEEVNAVAFDSLYFDILNNEAHFFNKAVIKYGTITVKAGHIIVNWEKKEILAEGIADSSGKIVQLPEFIDAEQTLLATKMLYNFDTRKAKVYDLRTMQGEAVLLSEQAKMINDSTYYAYECKLTTCTDNHPHFYLRVPKAKVLKDDKIVFGPSHMVLMDVPLPVGLPFGFVPLKKGAASGVLFPNDYGESQRGFFVKNIGYHFQVNDRMNLSVTADGYSLGSWRLGTSTSYRKRYKYSGNLGLNYSRLKFGVKETTTYQVQPSVLVNWSHVQDPKAKPGSVFSATVNAGSSNYLKNNSLATNIYQQNSLNSSISYSKSFDNKPYSFVLSSRHSQNTQNKTFDINLPDAAFNLNRVFPFKRKVQIGQTRWYEQIGVSYSFNLSNTINTYDSLLFKGDIFDKMKLGSIHNIPISTSFKAGNKGFGKYFTIAPTFNYNERWYPKTVEKTWNEQTKKLDTTINNGFFTNRDYDARLSVNTMFYGTYQLNRKKLKALRHTVIPSASFSYRPDFSEEQYGYYKSVQIDSTGRMGKYSIFEQGIKGYSAAGKEGRIAFNLSNILEAKILAKTDSTTALKKVKIIDALDMRLDYNLAVDSFNWNPFAISGRTNFANNFSINYNASWDFYATDKTTGRRINQYYADSSGNLLRFTNAGFTFSGSLRSQNRDWKSPFGTPEELNQLNQNPQAFIDFNIPYDLSFNYNVNVVKNFVLNGKDQIAQTLILNGSINLTPKWKFVMNTGLDITQKKLTGTQLSFYRDLHCWDMSFSVVPAGFNKSYSFTIKAKSQLLSDLKLARSRSWYDLR